MTGEIRLPLRQRPFEGGGRRSMLVGDCGEAKPADQRTGRERQFQLPLLAVDAGERIPQGAAVGRSPSVVDERRIERGSLARRVHETPRILVGTCPKQMELRGGLGAEAGRRRLRQQLDGPMRRTLPECQIRRHEIASRHQFAGESLAGNLIQQLGCPVRLPDDEKQRDGLQHQILGRSAPGGTRQCDVLACGFRIPAVRNELECGGFRHDPDRLAHLLLGRAPGEHDDCSRQ